MKEIKLKDFIMPETEKHVEGLGTMRELDAMAFFGACRMFNKREDKDNKKQ